MLKEEILAEDVDLQRLASETEGFSGSDLKRTSVFGSGLKSDLCVSAALAAVKEVIEVPWKATDRLTTATPPANPVMSANIKAPNLSAKALTWGTQSDSSLRVLHYRHFETALKEIRPSSTEEGSMLELRRVRSSLVEADDSGRSCTVREVRSGA